ASNDFRARAAATRVLRQMRDRATRPLRRLARILDDPHPRVRLEALVALSFFRDAEAAELALKVLDHERDRFLDYALEETLEQLDPWWRAALTGGRPFAAERPEGLAKLLRRLDDDELARVAESAPALRERLARPALDAPSRQAALLGLARRSGSDPGAELVAAIERADLRTDGHADHLLMGLFAALPVVPDGSRAAVAEALGRLAVEGRRASTRRLATAARMRAEGTATSSWDATADDPERRIDLLESLPHLHDAEVGRELFPLVLAALDGSGEATDPTRGRYVRVELPGLKRILTLAEVEVESGGRNLAPAGTASQESVAWGGDPERAIDGNTSGRFGDGGQTHTAETRTDPWWELDLGAATPVDAVTIWNRTDGALGRRLDGAVVSVLDAERRTVFRATLDPAPDVSVRLELRGPGARLRAAAVRAIGVLAAGGVRTEDAVAALAERFDDEALRGRVVAALREIPAARWPDEVRRSLAGRLTERLEAADERDLASPAGRELLAFADDLAPHLGEVSRAALLEVRRRRGPQVVVLRPVPDRLEYDRAEFTVVAGRPVELVFENVDIMPHNVVVTAPGQLATVGLAAEEMARDPDAAERGFVPDRPEVLWATRLLQPGERETLRFDAPAAPGDHPFVCTFPGHWVRMNGVMRVVADGTAPAPETTALRTVGDPGGRPFVRNWAVEDLLPDLPLVDDRSAKRGLEVMRAASCLACHATGDGNAARVGPDLREVVGRYEREELLRQVLEPSATIAEEYVVEIFVTYDGKVVAGRVVEEDRKTIRVQTDPYQVKPPVELRPRSVRLRKTSEVSGMPQGLLSTFQKGDILDLLAYLESLRLQERN
ncbi:MAG: plastocyanin/azurin family copper-binding protein, partial [Planctomycetota bacterium JB042]